MNQLAMFGLIQRHNHVRTMQVVYCACFGEAILTPRKDAAVLERTLGMRGQGTYVRGAPFQC